MNKIIAFLQYWESGDMAYIVDGLGQVKRIRKGNAHFSATSYKSYMNANSNQFTNFRLEFKYD